MPAITVASVDGSGSPRRATRVDADFASWLGAAVDRLIFRGRPPTGGSRPVTVRPDGPTCPGVTDDGRQPRRLESPTAADGQRVDVLDARRRPWHSPTAAWPATSPASRARSHVLASVDLRDAAIPTRPIRRPDAHRSVDGTRTSRRMAPDRVRHAGDRGDGTRTRSSSRRPTAPAPATPLGPSVPTIGDAGPRATTSRRTGPRSSSDYPATARSAAAAGRRQPPGIDAARGRHRRSPSIQRLAP